MTHSNQPVRRPAANNRELQQLAIAAIREAKSQDSLAPVTLLVSGAAQGWELRRQLVAGLEAGAAFANLRIMTSIELMQTCARAVDPAAAGDDRLVRSIAIEQLLSTDTGPLQAAAHHKDTAQLLTRLADELAWCELSPEQLTLFDSVTTTTASAAVGFVNRMRAELSSDVASRAWPVVARQFATRDSRELAGALGAVVVLEQRIPEPIAVVLESLEQHGSTVAVLQLTQHERDNVELVSCPDPTTEVAMAVREVVRAIAEGASPQSVAILYSEDDPYAALLETELDDSGIAWRGPTADTLATLTLPRVAMLFTHMASQRDDKSSGITRKDLMHWFAIGSMRVDGERVSVARLRTFIRDESLYGDATRWRRVLKEFAAFSPAEASQEDSRAVSRAKSREDALMLLRLIDALDAALGRMHAAPTWEALGQALYAAVEGFHMDPQWLSADQDERTAQTMLQDLFLRSLPRIDRLVAQGAAAPYAQLPQLLERQFLGRRTRHGSASVGIHVGPISSARGLVFDRLVVVGALEGLLPAASSGNPLLPDEARRVLRERADDLPTSAESSARAETELWATLSGCERVLVTYPRAGLTNTSDGKPSRFFAGITPRDCTSGLASLMESEWPSNSVDLAVRNTLAADSGSAELAPQLVAAEAWHQPALGTTFGSVPSWSMDGRTLSASAIESFLHCPYNFFVSQVLRISTDQYPDDIDLISTSDFGTLLHRVFEDFVEQALNDGEQQLPDFGGEWPEGSYARLLQILEREVSNARDKGLIGWEPAWDRQYDMVKESLHGFFSVDFAARATDQLRPAHTERKFGIDGGETVSMQVDEHTRVGFRGFIDRVDVSSDGRTVGVVDYKSGSTKKFESSMAATTLNKREKVQDLVYDLAARQIVPSAEQVHVNFLFFPNDGDPKLISGPAIDREALLRELMLRMQKAAQDGSYPPQPRGSRDFCPTCKLLGRRASRVTVEEDDDD